MEAKLKAENSRLKLAMAELKSQNKLLRQRLSTAAERIAAQSELLSKRAEKPIVG